MHYVFVDVQAGHGLGDLAEESPAVGRCVKLLLGENDPTHRAGEQENS